MNSQQQEIYSINAEEIIKIESSVNGLDNPINEDNLSTFTEYNNTTRLSLESKGREGREGSFNQRNLIQENSYNNLHNGQIRNSEVEINPIEIINSINNEFSNNPSQLFQSFIPQQDQNQSNIFLGQKRYAAIIREENRIFNIFNILIFSYA
jgi:hypothetical protein